MVQLPKYFLMLYNLLHTCNIMVKSFSQQALPIELNDYFHKIMVMGLSKQKMGIINNVVTHPSFIAITFGA